jgi:hypothetical protein
MPFKAADEAHDKIGVRRLGQLLILHDLIS